LDQPHNPDRPDHLNPDVGAGVPKVGGPSNPLAPPPPPLGNGPPEPSRPHGRGVEDEGPSQVDPGPPAEAPPAPPLTPLAWLAQNSPYLVLFLVIGGLLYWHSGLDGLVNAAKVVLGLGFVIFIHELGHFVAAKWCDVHVQTFSIGFGPALPGCSFRRGETTYKIALLPLGGYVSMVGEGPEADEDEDYPRSFKNKSVGQRMLIISAGVIMNVLFGAVAFILVYRFHGEPRPPAVIGWVDPGSPAWEAGVRPGWTITHIDGRAKPYFDDMRYAVALSRGGRAIPFTFRTPDGRTVDLSIEPRKDENDSMPVVGVATPGRLRLVPAARYAKQREAPVLYDSPAAFARALDLAPGDVVVASTDPDAPREPSKLQGRNVEGERIGKRELTPLPSPPAGSTFDALTLCRRMRKLRGEPMAVRVRRAGGKVETLDVPTEGFRFGDTVVGTTDADQPPRARYDPFRVKDLPVELRPDGTQRHDPFEFRRRLRKLAGKPMVIQVRREGDSPGGTPVNLLVGPAYHFVLGMRMKMGEVTGVRDGSPAARAALSKGDVIKAVAVRYGGGPWGPTHLLLQSHGGQSFAPAGAPAGALTQVLSALGATQSAEFAPWEPLPDEALDPVRLPYELTRRICGDPKRPDPGKWRVRLTVLSTQNHNAQKEKQLPEMEWDDTFKLGDEFPLNPTSPLSVPQLGLAYQVDSTVAKVEPDSPAAKAKVKENDLLRAIRFRRPAPKWGGEPTWDVWADMASKRARDPQTYDEWAYFFAHLQDHVDSPEVQVKVRRNGTDLEEPLEPMTAREDETWPKADRGLLLDLDTVVMKADSMAEAVNMGFDRTGRDIKHIYLTLSSLISGRVSTKNLGGPIEIAKQAFAIAGDNIWMFLLFLGVISINLAVVNFLPIPVLDGGHMVFLVYEKLRGRPPSEAVRAWATYVGLALILGLMVFVFYQDIMRLDFVRGLLGR
jgi:membrane-associated protease RseP (regulator of RpoE activity)